MYVISLNVHITELSLRESHNKYAFIVSVIPNKLVDKEVDNGLIEAKIGLQTLVEL